MKIRIGSIAVLAIMLVSCADENAFGTDGYLPSLLPYYLHLSEYSLEFPAEKSKKIINVKADNTAWKISGYDKKWLELSDTWGYDNKDIEITASANTSAADIRTSIFWFESEDSRFDFRRQVTATQQKAPPYLEIASNQKQIRMPVQGGEYDVSVSSNANWTATVSKGSDWLSVGKSSNGEKITISASANLTDTEREATVNVTASTLQVVLTVRQAPAADPTVKPSIMSSLNFPNTGGDYFLEVNSEVPWTASTAQSWIEVKPDAGKAGTTYITITAAPNSTPNKLEGNVYIKIGTKQRIVIPITQDASYFNVEPAELYFGRDAETQELTISGNVNWSLISKPEWLSVVYKGNQKIEASVTDWRGNGDRTGYLTLGVVGTTLQQSIKVSQSNHYFSVEPMMAVTIPSRGSEHQVHISTNDPWTARSSSTWMRLSSYSGNSDVDVTLTVPDNPSINERRDTTTFTPEHFAPVNICTTQKARYLKVGTEKITFFTRGGESMPIVVETDADYTITADKPWLTVNHKDTYFTVTAKENLTEEVRYANITIAMTGLVKGDSYELVIPVEQKYSLQQINIEPWDKDHSWDDADHANISITVTGFKPDQSWDDANNTKITIFVTGFKEEQSWNDNDKTNITIGVDDFTKEKSWNDADGSKMSIGIDDFSKEKSWNDADNSKVIIKVGGFSTDKSWD